MVRSKTQELILINPRCGNFLLRNIMAFFEWPSPPLSLLTLAALTPEKYHVRIMNYPFFGWPGFYKRKSLVAITCYTSNARAAYRLADKWRQKGATVILGGPHVSALPQEARWHCDSVLIGEAESVWPRMIEDFEHQALQPEYRGEPLEDFFSPVFPYFLRLAPWKIIFSGIQTTRGCKYQCEFCSSSPGSFRTVSQEQVLSLVARVQPLAKIIPLYFKDDNIFSDPAYAKSLFERLIPFGIKWFSYASPDIACDEEALKLAKESGCVQLAIGFETLDPRRFAKTSLQGSHKTPEDLLKLIRKIQSFGIQVRGSFVLGLDGDTPRDYLRLLWFFLRARFYVISLSILTPFPGSKLYRALQAQRRILTHQWERFDCLHVVFQPKDMSAFSLQAWFIILRLLCYFVSLQTGLFLLVALGYFLFIFPRLIS